MSHNEEQIEKEAQRLEAEPDSTIIRLEAILHAVPASTPLASLPARLGSLWYALGQEDDATATLFIEDNLRKYFSLAKMNLKPFISAYKRARKDEEVKVVAEEKKKRMTEILQRDINSSEVTEAITKIGIVDKNVLDIVFAATIASQLKMVPPIWLMLVGVPSSFKTELVGLIDLPEIYSLDTLSENAFSSGYVPPDGSEPKDLLPELDGKCFVIKDFTTIFSLKDDTVKKILGDLTAIFDGKFEKFTATRGLIRYASNFSMIGCITPAILAKHSHYMNQLGGRFFFLRIPELTKETTVKGFLIAWDPSDRKERIAQARQLVTSYCHQLAQRALAHPGLNPEESRIQQWIDIAAEFIRRARGTTITKQQSFDNENGEKISFYEVSEPQIEDPWRIHGQLRALARVLAMMRGKDTVTIEELDTLKPIVLASMPVDRAIMVAELLKEEWLTPREASVLIDKTSKTAGRDLKELLVLGLVDVKDVRDFKTEKEAKGYSLKPEFKAFLTEKCSSEMPF